jgi:hypothetical protein
MYEGLGLPIPEVHKAVAGLVKSMALISFGDFPDSERLYMNPVLVWSGDDESRCRRLKWLLADEAKGSTESGIVVDYREISCLNRACKLGFAFGKSFSWDRLMRKPV